MAEGPAEARPAGAGFTGWLYTTKQFWGVQWVAGLHAGLADMLLLLPARRWRSAQGENLVSAMLHGWKPRAARRHPEPPAGA